MAQSAVDLDQGIYSRYDRMVRRSVYNGLTAGTRKVASFFDDERERLVHADRICSYCGNSTALSIDHIFPKKFGGLDDSENLVLACKSCNSSKGERDLIQWAQSAGINLPLTLVKRYLKLCYFWCQQNSLLDQKWSDLQSGPIPFDPGSLALEFPDPSELTRYPRQRTRKIDTQRVRDAVGAITPGCVLQGSTSSSLIEVVQYVLETIEPCHVIVSVWDLDSFDLQHFIAFEKTGMVLSSRWLLHKSLPSRAVDCCDELLRHCKPDSVRCFTERQGVHFRNSQWNVTLFTTMNLNYNRGLGSYDLIDDAEILREVVEEQLEPAFRKGLTVRAARILDASRCLGTQGTLDF